MLEKLLKGLDFAERHSVGAVDEGINKLIQVPSGWLERRGISRQYQIDQLKIGTFAIAVYNSIVSGQHHLANIFEDPFASDKFFISFTFNFLKYSPLLALNSSDFIRADNTRNNDGYITTEPLITQRIRPYFLIFSLLGIAYGLENESKEAISSGIVALPLAISMYISGGSTGLWQKIKKDVKVLFPRLLYNRMPA